MFINKSLKQYRDNISLEGYDGQGNELLQEEIMTSIKMHCTSRKKKMDYELLAELLGYDIEYAAQ